MHNNKVVDYSIYSRKNGKPKRIGDSTSVTLPSLEYITDSIKGSGIIGEIDMPTLGQLGAMSTEISMRVTSEQYAELLSATDLEYRWANDAIDETTGKVGVCANKAFLKVFLKKADEGKLEPGAAQDGAFEYEVIAYKRIVNGKEVLNIDKLNRIYSVNGENMLGDLANIL